MAKVCFSTSQGMREEASFLVFEKDDPKLLRKRKNLSHYEEEVECRICRICI